MRMDTPIIIYKITKVSDGQGGTIPTEVIYNDKLFGNLTYLSNDKQMQRFGIINNLSRNLLLNEKVQFPKENKEDYIILAEGLKYKVASHKYIKNKTSIALEVYENEA